METHLLVQNPSSLLNHGIRFLDGLAVEGLLLGPCVKTVALTGIDYILRRPLDKGAHIADGHIHQTGTRLGRSPGDVRGDVGIGAPQ